MRYKTIPGRLFTRNRGKLFRLIENKSVVILQSNDQMVRCGDQYYPYRQSSDFFYLTGIEQEMSVLLLCRHQSERKESAQLFIRKPDPKLQTWEGLKLTRKEASRISGIETVHWLEKFEEISERIIGENANIYCRTQEQEKFKPEYPSRDERYLALLQKKYPKHKFKKLTPLLWQLRAKKEPEELELIRESIRITECGFNRVLAELKEGMKEFEIEALLTGEFVRMGATGHAYQPIIAAGENACFLHYTKNDQVIRSGQLVLMDFGAEYGNYAADCTRTIPVGGHFSSRQREIYEATLRLLRFARSLIKPGNTIAEINEKVWEQSEEEHIRLGLYTLKDVKLQKKEFPMYMKYLMHGVSHFIGLDVHDAGQIKLPLEEGMVLTCEPGIYIPAEKTGVRLENNLLVTENGNIDLMEDIPIEPGEIEELLGSNSMLR